MKSHNGSLVRIVNNHPPTHADISSDCSGSYFVIADGAITK